MPVLAPFIYSKINETNGKNSPFWRTLKANFRFWQDHTEGGRTIGRQLTDRSQG
jgi:hypothetical protein